MAGKRINSRRAEPEGVVVMLPGLYDETLKLLAEAHEYFCRHALDDQEGLSAREITMFTSEMSRVTMRLSCVMHWLVARKDRLDGKITQEQAEREHRLECRDLCINQNIEAESILPDLMTHLLDKSFELYQRVARLDGAAQEKSA